MTGADGQDAGQWLDVLAARLDRLNLVVTHVVLSFALGVSFAVDTVTGPRVSMLLLYCVITAAAAWRLGRTGGIVVAVACSAAAAVVRVVHPNATDDVSIVALNAILRAASLILLVLIVIRQRHAIRSLEYAAVTDGLTGLATRKRVLERLDYELAIAARTGSRVVVAFCDLDDLKATNDVHGHSAGDQLLIDFADAATAQVRATDLVGRLGGDEFILVLPGATVEGAANLLDRICAHPNVPAVSVGIAESSSDPREDTSSLLDRADAAMYRAKADPSHTVFISRSEGFGIGP